jgi:F-type H+-transporting ATPase subunit b
LKLIFASDVLMASPPKTDAKTTGAALAPGHAAGQHATVGVADKGHVAASAFPPFDKATFAPQLIWLALTFGFLYWMLAKKLLPRLSGVIEHRADGIRADLAEAEHLKSETEASLQRYEQALTTAKTNASGIAKSQRDTLTAETDREKAAVDTLMAAKVAEAEKRIDAGKKTAMAAVSGVATDTVGAIVAKLTGQTASTDEIARAIAAVKAK